LKAAQESLASAQERHRAGVATIADELQAKTVYSQTELALQSVEGQIQTLRGSLATAIGVPANIPVEAEDLPTDLKLDAVSETVDQLIERAEAQRPDLAAARLTALKAESHVRSVRAEGLPSLFAVGTAGRFYYYSPSVHPDTYTGSILLRVPIFTGGKNTNDVSKAREEAQSQWAQVETLTDQVILQVWTSYYSLKTSSQQVRTARNLYASAEQSEQVALGRYRAGVGSILDLLAAQTAFANARAQEIQARSNWFLSLAQLAHDTGMLREPVNAPVSGKGSTGSP
jgi:outer membrane protein